MQVCWDGGAHAFLLDTAVDPGWQHRGIGRLLVEAAAADAAAAGCERLHVDFEPHLEEFYLSRCRWVMLTLVAATIAMSALQATSF